MLQLVWFLLFPVMIALLWPPSRSQQGRVAEMHAGRSREKGCFVSRRRLRIKALRWPIEYRPTFDAEPHAPALHKEALAEAEEMLPELPALQITPTTMAPNRGKANAVAKIPVMLGAPHRSPAEAALDGH